MKTRKQKQENLEALTEQFKKRAGGDGGRVFGA